MERKQWIALIIVFSVLLAGLIVEGFAGTTDKLADHPGYSWDENIVSGVCSSKIVQLFVTGVITGQQSAAATVVRYSLVDGTDAG